MGVPGFFLWLMKNYKKEGFVFNKAKLLITDTTQIKNKKLSEEDINKIKKTNSVSIHIRRGDYLTNKNFFATTN